MNTPFLTGSTTALSAPWCTGHNHEPACLEHLVLKYTFVVSLRLLPLVFLLSARKKLVRG